MRPACWNLAITGVLAWVGGSAAQVNETTPGYFPFSVPALDVSESFTDMSFLNPQPAGAAGRVTIRDGHFVDAHGKRLRLLGSNLTFNSAFPPKDLAPRIAGHMRKLGMNVIRFHHMDMGSTPRGLWRADFSGPDPEQLDRLDWLIHQLKIHGIYTNLNLHVSRTYPGIPGNLPGAFMFGKGLDNYHPPFIEMQKEYARMLLKHRNPYTQTEYIDEPAVIVVEINNENSLTFIDWNEFRSLPEPFAGDLRRQWQDWLTRRYTTTENLRKRWDVTKEPLGSEILANGNFSDGQKGWTVQQSGGAAMELASVDGEPVEGGKALQVTTTKAGTQDWDLQIFQVHLDLEPGKAYTLSFRARSDQPRRIVANVGLDQPPWRICGQLSSVHLDKTWREYSYTFRCLDPEPGHCRVSFNFLNQVGRFWLAHASLRPGGLIGLPEGQSLEAKTIPIPPANAGDAERADFWQFLSDTECSYVAGMIRFLKTDLGLKAHVCCTQASFGGLAGIYREGTLSDYIDNHAYWEHPHFPNRPWDGNDWFIPNTSMIRSDTGGTLGWLAWHRMVGKPYTVSEYDHPAPNDHVAEMFPMLASIAAFQDWDGIYQFDYRTGSWDDEPQRIRGYFELSSHPGKLGFLPIAALMFRMEAVKAGGDPLIATVPTADRSHQLALKGNSSAFPGEFNPAALTHPVGFTLSPSEGPTTLPALSIPSARISNTQQIVWDAADSQKATFTVNAPAVRAAVGYVAGRPITLGDVSIHVKHAEQNWAAVAVGALDGKPIAESSRILLAAVGRVENSNMGWNPNRTSVGGNWGSPPIIAEGITADIQLPAGAAVTALDGTGKPTTDVKSELRNGKLTFAIGPEHRTLWYAIQK